MDLWSMQVVRAYGCAGIAMLVLVWCWPFAEHSFSSHMIAHMTTVAIAAPLLAVGMAGSRLDPVMRLPGWFSPLFLSVVEFFVVWLWHMPRMHHAAMMIPAVWVAEQASFFASGLALWISIFGGDDAERKARYGKGLAALLLTLMHMTLLGAILMLSPRPLYAMIGLGDQQWGGAVMLILGSLAYCAGGLWLASMLLLSGSRLRQLQPLPDPGLQSRR